MRDKNAINVTKNKQIDNKNEFRYWSLKTTMAANPGPSAEPKKETDEPAATTLPFLSILANRDSINGIQNAHENPSMQLDMK